MGVADGCVPAVKQLRQGNYTPAPAPALYPSPHLREFYGGLSNIRADVVEQHVQGA